MKSFFYIFVFLIGRQVFGQTNLIPNPSFEIITNCPTGASEIATSVPWFYPGTGTSDLFHICSTNSDVTVPKNILGYQFARTGNAYAGFFTLPDYREYIEAPLTTTLTAGTKYFFRLYASSADTVSYTSSALGVYFSTSSLTVTHYSVIPVSPQIQNLASNYFDCTSWKKFTGSFIASGGENHLTIGNFNATASSPSIAINSTAWPYNPCCTYLYVDDLCLSTDSIFTETSSVGLSTNKFPAVTIFPNPVQSQLTINCLTGYTYSVFLHDLFGHNVLSTKIIGPTNIDLSNISSGIYFLNISNGNSSTRVKLVVDH